MKIYNKYKIEHTDGSPLKGKKYFVLRLDSDDPIEAARVARAMRAYEGKLRNCDVFNTPVGAEEAFDNYFCQKMKTGRCNPANCDLPTKTGAVYCLTAWLYAPATERDRQDR